MDPSIADFERSPLRWTYDVLLAEYTALREEVQIIKQQIERTYGYMFAVVGALVASQLISSPAINTLNRHPIAYLAGAVVSLWFPLNNLSLSVDMTGLGAYLREVLAPKLNNLVELAAASTPVTNKTVTSINLVGWSPEVARLLRPDLRARVVAPMSWEEFLPALRWATRRRRAVLVPIYIMRSALLYVPSVLFTARFATLSPRVGVLEVMLLIILVVAAIVNLAAMFSVSNLVRYGQRRGPFKLVPDKARNNGRSMPAYARIDD